VGGEILSWKSSGFDGPSATSPALVEAPPASIIGISFLDHISDVGGSLLDKSNDNFPRDLQTLR